MAPKAARGEEQSAVHAAFEKEALRHLKRVSPVLYKAALPHQGQVASRVRPKRTNSELFRALASSIVSQQLSTKAAASIYTRVEAASGGKVSAASFTSLSIPTLRACGLSAAKVKTLKELSCAILSGELDLLKLRKAPPNEAVEKLTAIWGIGPWTAEMFLIFALGSPDVFSPGDLILARMTEELHGLPKGTHRKELERIAENWSPHRSYASLLLWKLHHAKQDNLKR